MIIIWAILMMVAFLIGLCVMYYVEIRKGKENWFARTLFAFFALCIAIAFVFAGIYLYVVPIWILEFFVLLYLACIASDK